MSPSRFSGQELRKEKPLTGNALAEATMGGRLDQINTGAEDCNRVSSRFQGTTVRRAVDAECQATHDGDPPQGHLSRQQLRTTASIRRGAARTDDGHRGSREQLEPPASEQHGRRVDEMAQPLRVHLIRPQQDLNFGRATTVQAIEHSTVEHGGPQCIAARCSRRRVEFPRAGIQRSPAGSESVEDPPKGPRAHSRHAAEP